MKKKKIIIHNLKVIKNFKGDIKKYLNLKIIKKFKISEVYFSEIKKNQIKGWNLHKKATCFLSVASGVKFQIKDEKFKLIKNVIINKKIINVFKFHQEYGFHLKQWAKILL